MVTGAGQLVAVSGQVTTGEDGQLVGPGDPSAQARQVFENLRRCLAAAGLSFGEVIKLTYYLTDMAYLPAVRTVRDEFIDTAHPPASTAVQVVGAGPPGVLAGGRSVRTGRQPLAGPGTEPDSANTAPDCADERACMPS